MKGAPINRDGRLVEKGRPAGDGEAIDEEVAEDVEERLGRNIGQAPANYEVRYQCRRCREVFRTGFGPEPVIVAALDSLTTAEVAGNRTRGLILRHEIHRCSKGDGFGFADLIGAEKVKN